jgi:hypothetical protein
MAVCEGLEPLRQLVEVRTKLLEEIREFFMANPTWE